MKKLLFGLTLLASINSFGDNGNFGPNAVNLFSEDGEYFCGKSEVTCRYPTLEIIEQQQAEFLKYAHVRVEYFEKQIQVGVDSGLRIRSLANDYLVQEGANGFSSAYQAMADEFENSYSMKTLIERKDLFSKNSEYLKNLSLLTEFLHKWENRENEIYNDISESELQFLKTTEYKEILKNNRYESTVNYYLKDLKNGLFAANKLLNLFAFDFDSMLEDEKCEKVKKHWSSSRNFFDKNVFTDTNSNKVPRIFSDVKYFQAIFNGPNNRVLKIKCNEVNLLSATKITYSKKNHEVTLPYKKWFSVDLPGTAGDLNFHFEKEIVTQSYSKRIATLKKYLFRDSK